jgi:hypothetical protein
MTLKDLFEVIINTPLSIIIYWIIAFFFIWGILWMIYGLSFNNPNVKNPTIQDILNGFGLVLYFAFFPIIFFLLYTIWTFYWDETLIILSNFWEFIKCQSNDRELIGFEGSGETLKAVRFNCSMSFWDIFKI